MADVSFRVEVLYVAGGQPRSAALNLEAPPGRQILLAYNPRSPGQVIVPSSHAFFGPSLVLFFLAALFCVAAVLW